ncbi:MAG: zinc ribbon domain-containing protein [Acidobacteria bacterium]|nr:zinc ribbon domain-containing protein [Acidobacteriota bacterium]
MFIVFGARTIQRDVKNGVPERRHCALCGLVSDFRQQRRRLFFTLFFLPVFPISRAESIITCNRCGTSYPAGHPEVPPHDGEEPGLEKTILVCPSCSRKMSISLKLDNAIRVTCPHCGDQFTVSVNRS